MAKKQAVSKRGQKQMKNKNKTEPNHKPTAKKQGGEVRSKGREKASFSEQYMPYIMGALGFVFTLFFILNAVSYGCSPEEHLVGPLGYGFCKLFFGLFGWPAFLLPVLFVYLAIFWRKNCRERTLVWRCILTAVIVILLSSVTHVFACNGDEYLAALDVPMLFETGALY